MKNGLFSTLSKSSRFRPDVKLKAPTKDRSYANKARSTKSTAGVYSEMCNRYKESGVNENDHN